MKSVLLSSILFLAGYSVFAGYVGYAYPAGAKAGETCEIIVGGRSLSGIKSVILDGNETNKDISVESVEIVPGGLYHIQKPAQKKYVNEWIRSVFKKTEKPELPEDTVGWDTKNKYLNHVDQLSRIQMEMLVRGFYTKQNSLQASPSIAQKAIIKLKIAQNAKIGLHQLRFTGTEKQCAVFNPIPFFIGDKTEFREPFMLPPPEKPDTPAVTLPAVLNGQILPGQTDFFRFHAQAGKQYTFRLYGRALLPFIGDGVPGHFQPVLQITNAAGKEIAFRDDTYFDPDPVLTFTVPADGDYTLAIRDAIYRGRDDFVYRVEITEGIQPYQLLPAPKWDLPIVKADQPEIKTAFPSVVEGTILPGQPQKIRIPLTKGETVVLEVWARRSLSPLDSLLKLYDPKGKQIAVNDDFPRPKIGTVYHHADSYLMLTVPATGIYTVELSDTSHAGGADYHYCLRIDRPHPDFRIWSMPSGLEIPAQGGTVPVGFVVERLDGHTGDITIRSENPEILIAGNDTIPFGPKRANSFESVCGLQVPFPDCTKDFLTLALRPKSKLRMTNLKLTAISGTVSHPVIPADESMQAFAYNHLMESEDCRAIAVWKGSGRLTLEENAKGKYQIRPGQELEWTIRLEEKVVDGSCSAELFAPPAGFSLISSKQGNDRIVLRVKADDSMKPCRFHQIIRLNFTRETWNKKKKQLIQSKASVFLPSVMIEIPE